MEIIPYGAAKMVTGSCYSIKTSKDKILIDCGMFQGNKKTEQLNYIPFAFNPKLYTALLLTHAHLDHCGRIPSLIKQGFKGRIYSTSATKDLAFVVMMDSAKIAFHDTENENRRRAEKGLPKREPIYTEDDVNQAMKLFQTIKYNSRVNISKNITAVFYDAGHILGASSIQLELTEGNETTTVVFSGDIGQENIPIVKDPEPIKKADYVFIESTYGDRLHPPIEERKNKFLDIIRNTHKKGGVLMIPSFAIERSQEILYTINGFVEKRLMPDMNVYLDSPMAIKATEVFKKHPECYDDELKSLLKTGDNPFSFPGLTYSNTVQDSMKINELTEPAIIIAGSGMCTAGRIKHHLMHRISDPKNTILFVGYQVEGTLGYWIKKGEKKIRLLGHEVIVNADVQSIDSFSGHADYNGLLNWLKHISPKPKKAFIIHGDEKSALSFSKKVEKIGINTHIPDMKEKISL
ncbi:MAG: MBL fold metallo-hydrolase [Nanoarchaeota archaeon]|nr:MBL fold metallo-hydrolase [Nanoarchaeota archaeon]MBU1005034.1 MBL fold metallo-hydrolase [Nanoarchaeota archaeon]MBU1945701.1 MBL fold metallo-hydrolase [Nanoarchaeota archaeon]